SNEQLAALSVPELLAMATAAGSAFRLYGHAVEVHRVSAMPQSLRAALYAHRRDLWRYLGGDALERPSLDLLTEFGVQLVIPSTEAEALAALARIEADSDANRPADLRRPGWLGFDIETAALPGTEIRPTVKLRRNG